jgi:hypothetical protein
MIGIQFPAWALTPGIKWPVCEVYHSPPSGAYDRKEVRRYTATPPILPLGVDRTTLP